MGNRAPPARQVCPTGSVGISVWTQRMDTTGNGPCKVHPVPAKKLKEDQNVRKEKRDKKN